MFNNIVLSVTCVLALSINFANFQEYNEIWQIEIPNISLNANIAEGTTKEVMDVSIGHFINTDKWNGNIGLAAHNRGYKVNYFKDLKDLKIGDKIIYRYKIRKKEYEIYSISIISDEDWSYLNNTEENTITLITCLENRPNMRRCIQGKQTSTKLFSDLPSDSSK